MQPAHQILSGNCHVPSIEPSKEEPAAGAELQVHVKQRHSNVLKPGGDASEEHARIDVWVNEGGAGGEVRR
jgi:hypothetical protein